MTTPMSAIAWRERAYYSPERTVLTAQELQIPGLTMLGRHHMPAAIAPLPDHYHPNCYEFTVLLDGALSFSVASSAEQATAYTLHRGDLFCTVPDEVHSTNLQPLTKGDILWFQLNPQADQLLFLSAGAAADLRHQLSRFSAKRQLRLPRHTLQSLQCLQTDRYANENRYALANQVAHLLYSALAHLTEDQKPLPPDIAAVLSYIEGTLADNNAHEFTLEALSRVARLSVSQLKQKFKVHVGMAPRHYINCQRIERAKADLLKGLSVTAVAMNHGFSSSSYFVVAFKRYAACTPSEFVKRRAQKLPDFLQQGIDD